MAAQRLFEQMKSLRDAQAVVGYSATADGAAHVFEQRIRGAGYRLGLLHLITIWILHDQNTAHETARLEWNRRRADRFHYLSRLCCFAYRAAIDARRGAALRHDPGTRRRRVSRPSFAGAPGAARSCLRTLQP